MLQLQDQTEKQSLTQLLMLQINNTHPLATVPQPHRTVLEALQSHVQCIFAPVTSSPSMTFANGLHCGYQIDGEGREELGRRKDRQ